MEIGRRGGRPPNPTIAEARAVKLEELIPRALSVLAENLESANDNVRQRAAEHVLDRAWGRPTQPTRQEIPPGVRLEDLPREQRDALIAEKKRQLEQMLSSQL